MYVTNFPVMPSDAVALCLILCILSFLPSANHPSCSLSLFLRHLASSPDLLEQRCSSRASDISGITRSDSAESTQSLQRAASELLLGLSYNSTTGHIQTSVIKGSNLSTASTRMPDTYVKLTLVSSSGNELARRKSSVRKGNQNPLFKEVFVFQVSDEEIAHSHPHTRESIEAGTGKNERQQNQISPEKRITFCRVSFTLLLQNDRQRERRRRSDRSTSPFLATHFPSAAFPSSHGDFAFFTVVLFNVGIVSVSSV